jgi:hypothetical protein
MAKRVKRRSYNGSSRTKSGGLLAYLPSFPQFTSELLAVLGATIVASFIISRVPALSKLVRDNTPPGPLNP